MTPLQPTPADQPVPAPQALGAAGIALPTTALSRAVARLVGWVGEVASLLWTVLIAVILIQVVARYAFGRGSIMMEELQWHLYAVGFMLGLSFTELKERNVRIDVLAEKFRPRTRLWIELVCTVGLFLPLMTAILWHAIPYFMASWRLNEVSAAPGGLPYRWFLKSFIITSISLLILVGLARLTQVWVALFHKHHA